MKKILLLAAMALAVVAFAAPAAKAEAPLWLHDGVPITEPEDLHLVGELSSTVGSGFITGPCEITFEGVAENVNGMAAGEVTGASIQLECPTNVEDCTFTPTLQNLPWGITGATITDAKGVEIGSLTFTNHYMGSCPVPVTSLSTVGYATAIVDEQGCLSLEDHADGLLLESPLPPLPVDLLGTICDKTLTLG